MRWITLSLVTLGLVALFVVMPGSAEVAPSEEAATGAEVAPAEIIEPSPEELPPSSPGTPALDVPAPEAQACTATVQCADGSTLMCELGGTSSNCTSGSESCFTASGAQGTRNFVQCGSSKQVCPCNGGGTCPDSSCGKACVSHQECPCGFCAPIGSDRLGPYACACVL